MQKSPTLHAVSFVFHENCRTVFGLKPQNIHHTYVNIPNYVYYIRVSVYVCILRFNGLNYYNTKKSVVCKNFYWMDLELLF